MNGIHDMGGMDGFGEVQPQDSEGFHDTWEKQVFAPSLLVRTGVVLMKDVWQGKAFHRLNT